MRDAPEELSAGAEHPRGDSASCPIEAPTQPGEDPTAECAPDSKVPVRPSAASDARGLRGLDAKHPIHFSLKFLRTSRRPDGHGGPGMLGRAASDSASVDAKATPTMMPSRWRGATGYSSCHSEAGGEQRIGIVRCGVGEYCVVAAVTPDHQCR